MTPLLWILSSVALSAAAQIFLKMGTRSVGPIRIEARGGQWLAIMFEKHIWAWALLNVLALALYLGALSKVDLSYAYPFITLSYVLIPMASVRLFQERVRPRQWMGIVVICSGVLLIALS